VLMSAVVSPWDVFEDAGTDRALLSAVTRIPGAVAASLKVPKVGSTSWIAPSAQVSGDVKVGDHCSIWYSCTVRGASKLRTSKQYSCSESNCSSTEVSAAVAESTAAVLDCRSTSIPWQSWDRNYPNGVLQQRHVSHPNLQLADSTSGWCIAWLQSHTFGTHFICQHTVQTAVGSKQ
jgi:hypothetical protein